MKDRINTCTSGCIATFAALAIAIGILLQSSCSNNSSAETSQAEGRDNWPKKLNYAYSPSSENPEARFNYYHDIAAYVSDYVGIPVELYETSSYGPMIEAMRARKIDIAQGGSFSYMIAAEKAGAEPLVTWGFRKENGGYDHGIYYSVIAVPKDSPLNTIEDLKAHAKDITFSFSDAASTSGHLVPRDGMEQAGIDVDNDFKRIVFTQSHLNSIMTIIAGKVEAGALQESAFTRLVETGKVRLDDLKIIWRSLPIDRGPIACRKALPRDLKEKIRSAFLEMDTRDPELFQRRFSLFSSASAYEGMVYVPAYDHMWDDLRDIAIRLENMKLIQGTKGLSDWNEAKRQAFLSEQQEMDSADFDLAANETDPSVTPAESAL